jgi:hypothetical protein
MDDTRVQRAKKTQQVCKKRGMAAEAYRYPGYLYRRVKIATRLPAAPSYMKYASMDYKFFSNKFLVCGVLSPYIIQYLRKSTKFSGAVDSTANYLMCCLLGILARFTGYIRGINFIF